MAVMRRNRTAQLPLILLMAMLLLAISSITWMDVAYALSQPSWYPRQSCKQAWGGRDKGRFQHRLDSSIDPQTGNLGYDKYKKRLEREGIRRENCYKDWTVLVYMAADNNLSPYALWDVAEMEGAYKSGNHAGSTLRSDLLVQLDTRGNEGVRRLHVFQNEGSRFVAPKSVQEFENASPTQIQSPIVRFTPETGPTQTEEHKNKLRDFLEWGMRHYPAEHYMVIVWGHGQGWASDLPIQGNRFGGFVFSEENDHLSVPALSSVLKEVQTKTLEGARPIDVYAADACLMQMAEVAYEISDSTRFIIGSAQIQSYLGLPYRQVMYHINTARFYDDGGHVLSSDDEAYSVARMLPILSAQSFHPTLGLQGRADPEAIRYFTMSALSAPALRYQLEPALELLSEKLLAYLAEDPLRGMDLQDLLSQTPSFMGGARELGSFIGLLQLKLKEDLKDEDLKTPTMEALLLASEKVREAIQLTSINYRYGKTYQSPDDPLYLLGFRGLGIWLPRSRQEFMARIEDFENSKFYQASTKKSWGSWLKAVFSSR